MNPLIKDKSIIHDSHFCKNLGGEPYPTQRKGNCFIAFIGACNTSASFFDCPIECRPKDHLNWTKC